MKSVLILILLVISTSPFASGQQRRNQAAPTRAEIREAERLLSQLGYWTSPIDGHLNAGSRSALIAFQKWEGRAVTGKLTPAELDAIRAATPPQAREVGYAHVEVDLDRQILMWVNEDGGVRVLPVSSGNDQPFVDEGKTSIAYTPRGRFLVYDKVSFVSAKSWVENSKLKEAALQVAITEHIDYVAVTRPTIKSAATNKARSRLIRA